MPDPERAAWDGAPSLLLSVALSRDDVTALHNYTIELIATARAQGARDMRDAILRWHQEQWIKYRELSGTNAIAGAHMTAHGKSFVEISALRNENIVND